MRQYLWWEPRPASPEETAAEARRRARLAEGVPAPAAPVPAPRRYRKPPVTKPAARQGLRMVPCQGGWWLVGNTYPVRAELGKLGLEWVADEKKWFCALWQGAALRKWLAAPAAKR